jgi:excisionase family DNA binding protein
MNTAEVAEYLRLKERKVYQLVREERIPCTRITGKLLFPRSLVDLWILRNTHATEGLPHAAPPVIAGSHDPLLAWTLSEAGAGLAQLLDGSMDGLQCVAQGAAVACGIHVLDPETGEYNTPFVRRTLGGMPFVTIEWAWREQGLILPPGNPLAVHSLADVAKAGLRFVERQPGAGSRLLLEYLLARHGLEVEQLRRVDPPARSETDVAAAVLDGTGDVGLGIRAVARQFRLAFVPVHRERFDLVVGHRDYFEPPMQRVLAFAAGERFREKARALGGYDVSGLGRVIRNA